MKREFIKKISLLQMSKQLLVSLENVGVFNQRDKCHYSLNLSGHNLVLRYIFRIFKNDWSKLSKTYVQFRTNILEKCGQAKNQQLDLMSLGQRDKTQDVSLKFKNNNHNFSLLSFSEKNLMRFVVAYLDGTSFLSEDIYQNSLAALQKKYPQKEIKCIYHSDDYFTDQDMGELYLITFEVPVEEKED